MIVPAVAGVCYLFSSVLAFGDGADLPGDLPVTDGLSAFLEADTANLEVSEPVLLSEATPSGMPAVGFDGVSDFLRIDGNPEDFDGRAKTTLVVFRPEGLVSGRMISTGYSTVDPEDPDLGPNFRVETLFASSADLGTLSVNHRDIENGFVLTRSPAGSVAGGEYYVGVSQWRENGDILVSVRDIDNERFVTENDGADGIPTDHLQTLIGAHGGFTVPDASDFFPGEIAAVLIYNRELSASELEETEEYLHGVYLGEGPGENGLELPVTEGIVAHLNATNVEQATGDIVDRMVDVSGRGNDAYRIVELDGASVVRVVDRSGRGNHAMDRGDILEAREPRLLPAATPAGRDAISFDGLSGYLDVASNPEDFDGEARGRTSLVVFRPKSAGWAERFYGAAYASLDPDDPDSGPVLRAHNMFISRLNGGSLRSENRTTTGGSEAVSTSPDGAVTERVFYVGVNNWTDDGTVESIVVDGENQRFFGSTSGADGVPQGHLHTRIGADPQNPDNPLRFSNLDVAAVLFYNRSLSASELDQMEQYLFDLYLGDGLENEEPPVSDGLVTHLTANEVEVEGDRVLEVEDLTGRGNHAQSFIGRQTFNAALPSFGEAATPSGRGVLQFSGSEVLEIKGNPEDFDGIGKTTFVIFRPNSLDGHRIVNFGYAKLHPDDSPVIPASRTHNMEARSANNGSLRMVNRTQTDGFNNASTPDESVATGEFFLAVNHLKESGDFEAIVRNIDDERLVGESSGADAEPEEHLYTRIGAGASFQDERVDLNFDGDIAAVVIFNRELGETELLEMEEYLHARYLREIEAVAYATWIDGFDVPEGLSAPGDDASGDGVTNLEKFAFGLNPLEVSRAGLPEAVVETEDGIAFVTLSVPKNPEAAGVEYQVETSGDLLEWVLDSEAAEVIEDSDDLLQVRFSAPIDEVRERFVRARVILEDQ